ncbi:uncharacterized protein HKW66_Vig0020090 [Vigna angularis]|uniref:Ribosomal RNA-processing protein 14/surfeit locus protein 6 C-terminal domain-containing protein n=2 Tax=Phaseolus angularis TaxID=3914 RepID=A0A8T0L4U2_PHAAN|nr:uncharacterized protein LOC108342759 [Vigna angularis]KAG2407187.1 uncharacterized protein HKW66_Vig0020090 [Vigna angularis]BAT77178.1 hypothetical protein VIGAN_01527200 [Vigna angularis var. angularis]
MKNQKRKGSVAAESDEVVEDLGRVIHEHTLFFDKLIELIPAKFYLPTDDKEKPWFQGLSKASKAEAKKETKENIKKSRRDRLDPDKSSATTLDLLKESLGKEKVDDSDGVQVAAVAKPLVSGLGGDDRSVTYEELRQRLHRKLEEFRAGRNLGNAEKKREERNAKRGYKDNKRKRDDETEKGDNVSGELAERVKKDAAEASKELVFGHVKLQNEEMLGKKKRKLSKHKELERAKKLEEVKKNDPEKAEVFAKKQSWKAAMDRASGVKVHDDPKLLKKSINKEKKKQQKNSEKWKDRIQTRDQLKAEKQKKRSENISARIHEKKMRKIAKREKKLMRPGFEGRKEGFMNEGGVT